MPIPDQEALTIARSFVENVICRFGIPEILLTDQGSNFVGKLFKEVCKIFKIKKLQTSAYHPQTNGALERSHRTIAEHLRSLMNPLQNDWDRWICIVNMTYNTTVHTSTGFQPFEILFGYPACIPSALACPPKRYYCDDYVTELKIQFQNIWQKAKNNMDKSKRLSKRQYDKKVNFATFQKGDLVLLRSENIKKGLTKKLSSLRHGPYKIVDVHSKVNYSIDIGKRKTRVHMNRLQKYYSRTDFLKKSNI
jgi:hypothetical protein